MSEKDGKDKLEGFGVEEWLPLSLTIPGEPKDVPSEEALRSLIKEKIGEAWGQFAEKETSELQAMKTFLQERREELIKRLNSTNIEQPEKSDEDNLPMSLGDWQKLPPTERRRSFLQWYSTLDEILFRLSIIKNVMWRRSMFDDYREWSEVERSGDADVIIDVSEDTTPIPLNESLEEPEELGREFVKACKDEGLIAEDTDPKSAAKRLFTTEKGKKVKWTGHKTALIRLFDLLFKEDVLDKAFWDERNAALKRHFLYCNGNGECKPMTRLARIRSEIGGKEIQQEEAVQKVVSHVASHLSA